MLSPLSAEAHALILEAIRQTPFEELIAMMEYRKPGIPETDMNGDSLELYRERREQREATAREAHKDAA